MRIKVILSALLLILGANLAAAADQHWLHVRVEESGRHGEKVSINLPFDLIEAVIEGVEVEELERGIVHIEDAEFDRKLVRTMLDVVKKSKDGVFVTVESERGEIVNVAKKGDELHIRVEDEDYEDEVVSVLVPLAVAEALLEGDDDELNLLAALRELNKRGPATLVQIESEDETVRVWIDTSQKGI
ncbi:MAG: hypothetical protein JW819_04220 [Candidatus Krumholzibacteriota bacterium]|nr:hypothetical protein [Candidatus Krumholzibacteriota bacterium]